MTELALAQVVQHMRPGGIERLVLDLAAALPAGKQSVIISLEGNRREAFQEWPILRSCSQQLIFLDKSPGRDVALPFRLARVFRQRSVGYIHTHHIGPLLYAGLASRLVNVKAFVHTEHDAWHLDDRREAALTRRAVRLLKPRLVADAACVADALRQHGMRKIEAVIMNGVDTTKFAPSCSTAARNKLKLPANVPIIGVAGRLEQVKNQAAAIAALAQIIQCSRFSNVALALAGSGRLRKDLERQAMQAGLDGKVHFLGHVEDMACFYNAVDLFCLPSFKEGLPLSLLEAQSCGIPVCASDVGGSREATCPETGMLFEPTNIASIAVACRRLLQDAHRRDPRPFVLRTGTKSRMVEAYRDVFAA